MKRPSAWPLLAIVLVVVVVFTLLVFHDRIRQAEQAVAQVQQALQSQVDQARGLQQTVDELNGRLADLQQRLSKLSDAQQAQDQQVADLSQQVQALPQTNPPVTTPSDERAQAMLWVLAAGAFIFGVLSLILR